MTDSAAPQTAAPAEDAPAAPAPAASAPRFAAQLKTLPKVSHLAALALLNAAGEEIARVENRPGQTGSLAVYNHLAQLYGALTPEAARKGLELFAEHTEHARAQPGKHPNIDRLFGLIERNETLRIKQVFAL